MSGFDPKDSTSVDKPVPDFTSALGKSIKGLKVGIPQEYSIDGIDPEVNLLWDKGITMLKDAGAEIISVSLPHTKYALPVYYIIAPAEASSNLARYDGVRFGLRVPGENLSSMYENTRGEGFGQEVRRRILMGTYVLSAGYYDAYYLKAQKVRRRLRNDFDEALKKCDVLLTPTAPGTCLCHWRKSRMTRSRCIWRMCSPSRLTSSACREYPCRLGWPKMVCRWGCRLLAVLSMK